MAKTKARASQPKIAARWLREAQGVVALGLAAVVTVAGCSSFPTPGADRAPALGVGDRMHALRVVLVHLDLCRHALLLHEHGKPDASRLRARLLPVAKLDPDHDPKV